MDRHIILDKPQAWQKAYDCVLLDSMPSGKIEANHALLGTAIWLRLAPYRSAIGTQIVDPSAPES